MATIPHNGWQTDQCDTDDRQTDFLLLDNHDININSFCGDLKQLKNETRKLQADKEKEEVLEDSKTEKSKPDQLLEELKRLVKGDITKIG